MSAPKRTRPLKTVWLQPRTEPDPPASFKRRVLDNAGATDAFQKLTSEGLNEDLLWRHLWGLASLADKSKQQHIPWYVLPGLPPHTLRRFPDRVRRMADEIERMDEKMRSDRAAYGATVHFLPLFLAGAIPGAKSDLNIDGNVLRDVGTGTGTRSLPAARARNLLHRLDELPKLATLPKLLRFYADYIEALSKIAAYYGSKGAASLPRMMRLELVRLVENCTGKPHWNEVATLLTASYQSIGCNLEADPRALKMQRSRTHSKK